MGTPVQIFVEIVTRSIFVNCNSLLGNMLVKQHGYQNDIDAFYSLKKDTLRIIAKKKATKS